jgi:DNA-binding NtrC family response regulator
MEKCPRILIVDDEEELCQVLTNLLSGGKRYSVESVTTAEAAMAKIETEQFALILCDYKLGGEKTGLDVLFKAKEKDPNVITILMTGFGTDQLAIRAVAEGVYDYITKPFKSILDVRNIVDRGMRYYTLLVKYDERVCDEELQRELLKATLEKARRTREILRALVTKIGGAPGAGAEDNPGV